MNADIRMSIRSCARTKDTEPPAEFLTKNDTFLGPWKQYLKQNNLKEIPASGIMSRLVEDYMVLSYLKQGFYNSKSGSDGTARWKGRC